MTIYNREDYKTVLPQLEKKVKANHENLTESLEQLDKRIDVVDNNYLTKLIDSLAVEQYKVVDNSSIASGGIVDSSLPITKDGYYPIGVVGVDSTTRYFSTQQMVLTDIDSGYAVLDYFVWNSNSSARTGTVTIHVLWIKEN